jgi:hypothetical protein
MLEWADGTFVCVDDAHRCRLADDGHARTRQAFAELGQHRAHAGAADFLVVGERDVQGCLERSRFEVWHGGQHTGEEALHVRCAAAVIAAVAFHHLEGVGIPGLPGDGHDVGMAGKGDTGHVRRANGGEQAGLGAVARRHQRRRDAMLDEIVLHEANERDVGLVAGGVERHEAGQQLGRRIVGAFHFSGPCWTEIAATWIFCAAAKPVQ